MSIQKIAGIVLLVAGILVLVYRGFTYTKETHTADLGAIELQVKERENVTVPVWVGVALAAAGGGLLAFGKK